VARTLIFDFDGTIADTLDITMGIAQKLTNRFGNRNRIDLDKEALRKMDIKSFMRRFGIPWYRIPAAVDMSRDELKRHADGIRIFEGMKQVIENLRQSFSLGILTTNKVETVHRVLKNNAIDLTAFRFIVGGGSLFGKKKILSRIRRSEKLEKSKMVYIGDEVRDIQAARKFRIATVAVSWGYNDREVLKEQRPDHLVDQPLDLMSIF
jgi:phosphoglycolate phosphatase